MAKKKNTVKEEKLYFVLRDTQEKKGIWQFNKSSVCAGTKDQSLDTGDYTLEGFEHIFAIERKASTGEIAGNVCTKQFANEMKRADRDLKHFFVVCEFSLQDVLNFPFGSHIPPKIWPKLKITANLLLKKIIEFEINHNVTFIFCGNATNAKEVSKSIFKRMIEKYSHEIN